MTSTKLMNLTKIYNRSRLNFFQGDGFSINLIPEILKFLLNLHKQ